MRLRKLLGRAGKGRKETEMEGGESSASPKCPHVSRESRPSTIMSTKGRGKAVFNRVYY